MFDGPWIDDILLRKYYPGVVTVCGTLSYVGRYDSLVGAPFVTAKLYDEDIGGDDDVLGETHTLEPDGYFQFDGVYNWDDGESEVWELDYEIIDQTNPLCGIQIMGNEWIAIFPSYGFIGTCYALIQVSDTIMADSFLLQVNVVDPVYFYAPIVIK